MLLDMKEKKDKTKCRGLVFRADVSHCRTVRGALFSVRLNKMKRLSCPGCNSCWAIEDGMCDIDLDWPIIGIEKVQHGKLYTIKVCNEQKDWEAGVIVNWNLRVVEWEVDT